MKLVLVFRSVRAPRFSDAGVGKSKSSAFRNKLCGIILVKLPYLIGVSGGKVSAEGSREEILPGLLKENSSGEKCPLGRTVPEKEDF